MVTNKRLRWIALCSAVVLILATAISIQGAGAWTDVTTFSGPGGTKQDTAPFAVRGAKVRFLFTVQPNSSGPVPFLAQMFPKGAAVSANELHRTSCIACDGPQTDDLGNVRQGSYYLHVITSRPWTLTVQENR